MKRNSVIANFFWRFAERFLAQFVGFSVSIVLARLLMPEVYGIVALASIVINVVQVFVDGGLSVSLIQAKTVDDRDYSSVFWFNLLICLIVYCVVFFASPLWDSHSRYDDLSSVIRVLSLVVIFSAFKSVPQAIISRNLQFKKFFFVTIIGTAVAACFGLFMAFNGFGVWSLVVQHLINSVLDTVLLWIVVGWKPRLIMDSNRLKKLLSFGWKMLLNNLVSVLYTNSRQLLIGIKYSADALAYYNRANEFPNKIVPNIESSISSVLLPRIAQEQDNLEEALTITRRSINLVSFVLFPMMIGMCSVAKSLILLLLTEKWMNSVQYLYVFCFEALIWPLSSILNNSINAIGKPSVTLKIQSVTRVIGILSLFACISFGPFAIAICALSTTIIEFLFIIRAAEKVFNYTVVQFLSDVVMNLILSIVMGVIVIFVGFFALNSLIKLVLQILCGVVSYFLLTMILNKKIIFEAKSFLRARDKKTNDNCNA